MMAVWAAGGLPAFLLETLLLQRNTVVLLVILVHTIPRLAGCVCGNGTIWVSEIDIPRYQRLNTAGCS